MDEITELTNKIAEALGLQDATVNNDDEPIPMPGWWSLPGVAIVRKHMEPPDIIVFSAYAKGEMARRGMAFSVQSIPMADGLNGLIAHGGQGGWDKFDPTDPIAEAVAVLKAISEII